MYCVLFDAGRRLLALPEPMPSSPAPVRIAILGASSLRGKELKEHLVERQFPILELRLFDEEFAAGTLTEAAGEPAIVEGVTEESLRGTRLIFMTGTPEFSRRHCDAASHAGANVIDLSGGLAGETGALPLFPAMGGLFGVRTSRSKPSTLFLAPSAPADVAVSLTAALARLGLERLILTFFQPASELGMEGVEELESQVAKLLSMAPLPQAIFGGQAAFTMLWQYGAESRAKIADARAAIVAEVRLGLQNRLPMPAIALVHAPVFHSNFFTAYADFKSDVALEEIIARLSGAGLKVVSPDDPPPTNVSVAGEPRPVLGRPERDPSTEHGVWIWGVADNLRVPVATAVAIAENHLAE
jgi:aspartate-semialdehyde dehydrogenase